MTESLLEKQTLLDHLQDAALCCISCGTKYGNTPQRHNYATFYEGTCDVCYKYAVPVTEVRDFGYFGQSIRKLQSEILEMKTTEELYTLELTEKDVCELYAKTLGPSLFSESLENKICDLYENELVKYELSSAAKAFMDLYGVNAFTEKKDLWEAFRDGFNLGAQVVTEVKVGN